MYRKIRNTWRFCLSNLYDFKPFMANVGERDHVIDLGSGDGVIVITAGHRLKASGYGVDIDEELVRLSNQRAKSLGIDGRVRFEVKDIFKADVSKATVITLYLCRK